VLNLVLAGKYVKEASEKSSVRNALVEKLQSKGIIEQLQKVVPFNVEDLEFTFGYNFTQPDFEEEKLIHVNIAAVRANDQVQVKNIVIKDENQQPKAESIIIDVIKGDKVETYMLEDNELVKTEEFSYDGNFLEAALDRNQIHNEDYQGVVEKDFLFPFCLAGGYKFCGPGCGDGLTYGGGTPINAIDSCCRAHDRCYSVFGYGDHCCDQTIDNCAKANRSVAPTAADLIITAFHISGTSC
jgi:hypothetical protein